MKKCRPVPVHDGGWLDVIELLRTEILYISRLLLETTMAIKIKREDETSMNLTPLIDIVFLLIIFFMVGSRFTELNEAEKNIPLQVPTVSDAKALTAPPSKRIVNVLNSGQIVLDNQPVTLEQLQLELASSQQQYRRTGVVVRGDAGTAYQHVADVIAACRQANVSDLNISVRVAQQPQTNF